MSATNVTAERAVALLAADTVTLAHALTVGLIKEPFTYTPAIDWADITNADFTGSDDLPVATAARLTSVDPATGDQLITIPPPAGGWYWETTAATNLPQTIYGIWVGNDTPGFGTGDLLDVITLPEPIQLTAVNQSVVQGLIQIRLPQGALN